MQAVESRLHRYEDFLLGLFGYSRARFPQKDDVVDAIMAALADCGAVKCGEGGMPTATDEYYFRIRGRKMKVIIEDWGDIILWGPTGIVRELANKVSKMRSIGT